MKIEQNVNVILSHIEIERKLLIRLFSSKVSLPISCFPVTLVVWVEEHPPYCPCTGEEGLQTLLHGKGELI